MKAAARRGVDVARYAPEAVVAVLLGVLFTALGLLHLAKGDTLSEVTLLVLSVLAASVVRDRASRAQLTNKLSALDEDVRALTSGEPYHALRYVSSMDIRDGGAVAYARRTKKIRFDQNSVLSISDLSESTGTRESYSCTPKALTQVGDFSIGGRLHSIISLGRPWQLGEELEFTIAETLRDAFVADREDVTVDIAHATDELTIEVTWPDDRGVEEIFVERFGRLTPVRSGEILTRSDGRPYYRLRVEQPQLGETISVVWDWADLQVLS